MNKLSNLRIGTRIGLAFAATIVLLIGVAVLAGSALGTVNHSLQAVTKDFYVKVQLVGAIEGEINKQARFTRNLLILDQTAQLDAELKNIEASRAETTKLFDKLQPLVQSIEGKARFAEVLAQRMPYRAGLDEYLALVKKGDVNAAKAYLTDTLRVRQLAYMKAMEDFSHLQESLMDQAGITAEDTAKSGLVLVSAISVGAVALSIVLGIWITRSITRPLLRAVHVANTVAAGDLSVRIDVTSQDEVGQLLGALKNMNDSLVGIVSKVRASSDSIATGSGQIATGNADLSQRTEEQASNLEQTAAAMEQLTSAVKQNADTARQASQIALDASKYATEGGAAMDKVVHTMGDIASRSRQIADIISVIDGIAFQTNILALNAAVEAARAGEQGRGFAVVASEVRSLAGRSATAAKEIKALIDASVASVEAGGSQVDAAGQTMSQLVSRVAKVASLIEEISTASSEQDTGISQVGDAVQQLDTVTQQNAALVEESAAAADSLNHQAASLANLVSVFTLPTGLSPAHTSAPSTARGQPKLALA
jgi:methyl-accepting chemotaxis protein